MHLVELFALLVAGHALADYPLQGQFLAQAKNHRAPLDGMPWWIAMAAHSIIHGAFVGVLLQSLWLGLAETVVHFYIDYMKCDGRANIHQDQLAHITCKLVWVIVWAGQRC